MWKAVKRKPSAPWNSVMRRASNEYLVMCGSVEAEARGALRRGDRDEDSGQLRRRRPLDGAVGTAVIVGGVVVVLILSSARR